MKLAAVWTVAWAIALSSSVAHAAPGDNAAHRFDQLKRLVGTWQRADQPASSLRIRFSLTAGGTVLIEEWKRGEQSHSMTAYHRDNETIVATHYCPQGNQPRLTLTPESTGDVLRFGFRDATDLHPGQEAHLTALTFVLSDPEVLVRGERYRNEGRDEDSTLRLVRAP